MFKREYASVIDLVAAARAPATIADTYRSSRVGTEKFTGTASFDEAVKLARTGWSGGSKTIESMRASIEELLRGSIPIPEVQYAVRGRKINMGRYLSGQPDCFVQMVDKGKMREASRPSIVTIVVAAACSGSVSADTILRRGAAMVVLIDTLERHRIRCHVKMADVRTTSLNAGRAEMLEYVTTIKEPGDYVSLDKLAFWFAHPSALRRLMLSVSETEPDGVRRKFGLGRDMGRYGIPGSATDQGDIYLDRILSATDWSEDLTFAWLKKTLIEQGIVLETK